MTEAEKRLEKRIAAARQWMEDAFNEGDRKSAREWAEVMRDLIAERTANCVAWMEKKRGLR